jgi:hypothetical protein
MINPWQTVVSQYANSPQLLALIDSFNDAVDPRATLELFYRTVWNLDTATGYGLDVWGRIVGIDRSMEILALPIFFGFGEAAPGVTTLGFGPFYGGQPLRQPFTLPNDDAYRRLIYAKAMTNLTDGSITSINQILMTLFHGRGNAYVREEVPRPSHYFGFAEAGGADGFDGLGAFGDYLGFRRSTMTVTYVFDFALEPWEEHVVRHSEAIPRIAGVTTRVQSVPRDDLFLLSDDDAYLTSGNDYLVVYSR